MIFVTVGTNEAPFDRLVEAVRGLPGEIVLQHGASTVRPGNAQCIESLPYEAMIETMRRAEVVITHAGVGSVLTALAAGMRPVVVPRLRRYGEAVDDHQLEFARHLASSGLVRVVEDPTTLAGALDVAAAAPLPELGPSRALVSELREYLARVLGAPRYSR